MPKTAPNDATPNVANAAKNARRKARREAARAIPSRFKVGFLESLDKRTDLARCLRQNMDAIVQEQGGDDSISHTKRALIERFVWLEAVLQSIEHELVTTEGDKAATLSRWVQALNTLSGLAKTIGVERKVTTLPWLAPAAQPEGSQS